MNARARHLLKRFGITEEQYNDLLRKQKECCAVCKRRHDSFKTKLCVDHDHSSGEIRGLLCIHCNRYVVGRHRREKGMELLLASYEYLARPEYTGWLVPPRIKKKRKKRRKSVLRTRSKK